MPKKSKFARDAILVAAYDVALSKNEMPTIRKVSERSGYSIGSIYRYFRSADELVFHLFEKRLIEILDRRITRYKSIKPEQNIDEIAMNITEMAFEHIQNKVKLVLVRKLMLYVARHTKKPYYFISLAVNLVSPIIAEIQKANITGTLKVMSQEEIIFNFNIISMSVYSPILERSPIAGKEKHRQYVRNLIKQIFGVSPS